MIIIATSQQVICIFFITFTTYFSTESNIPPQAICQCVKTFLVVTIAGDGDGLGWCVGVGDWEGVGQGDATDI